jgi:hypothetical protein
VLRGGLQVLRYADFDSKHPMLPSWVPNWNSSPLSERFYGIYNAGFLLGDSVRPRNLLLASPRSLKICGLLVGTVIGTSSLKYHDTGHKNATQDAALNLKVIEDAYHLGCRFGTPTEVLAPFTRTLNADRSYDYGVDTYTRYQQNTLEDFNWYMQYLNACVNPGQHTMPTDQQIKDHVHPYVRFLANTWRNRCFFVTDNYRMGLASQSCQPGDKICIFFSADTPFVLRPVENKDSFTLISNAYVDGFMYGEALEERDASKDRDFIVD